MSSPQYPVRLLFLATALSYTLMGCASEQVSSPLIAGGDGMDPARERFLSGSKDDDSPSVTVAREIEPGAPAEPENIDAILDEMLAGHEALQSRKAEEAAQLPVEPETTEASSEVLQIASVESSDHSVGEILAESSESGASTSGGTPDVVSELPRIEPSTEMIRALMASAADSDAPLKQHLALAMLVVVTEVQSAISSSEQAAMVARHNELRVQHCFSCTTRSLTSGGALMSPLCVL